MIFVLIGGKNKDSNLNIIEKKSFLLSNKAKPKILYIPQAATNIDKSINKFLELVKDINLDITCLNDSNLDSFEKLVNDADIIYVGGGVSDNLVKFFIDKGFDDILKKYLNSNKIYVGSSAGAMLISKIAMGDKDMYLDNFHNYNYKMVKCLGILNISICPHYQNEDLIIYNDEVKKFHLDSFGIEEDTALVIDNDKFYVIKDKPKASLYYFKNGEEMIPLYEGNIYQKAGGFYI